MWTARAALRELGPLLAATRTIAAVFAIVFQI